MMNDSYAPCPCGSGKKMKFCKCVDQPQEYEKIVRFLQGGQELAAMDRINQLLAKSPNAAWLLAMKAETALSLQEFDTFKETVNRFLKLKPDNPLALTMRSFIAFYEGEPIENGVRLLIEGLAESRESLPTMIFDSLRALCERLRASDLAPLRFNWVRLLEEIAEQAELLDGPVEQNPSRRDNLLSMSSIVVPTYSPNEPWAERAREVQALLRSFRYAQAETKLRSILRDYPDQVAVLTQLLETQILLLDQSAAVTTARKLGSLRGLDEATRDYFTALALELEPGRPALHTPLLSSYVEVVSDDDVLAALGTLDFVYRAEGDEAKFLGSVMASSLKEEVPAQHIYHVRCDRQTSDGQTVNVHSGTLAVFGRQTDKPPRVLIVMSSAAEDVVRYDQILSALKPVKELPDPGAPRSMHYVDALMRVGTHPRVDNKPLQDNNLRTELVVNELLHMKFPALDNLSLLEAVQEESKRAMVRAMLTHFEGTNIPLPSACIRTAYDRLQIPYPEVECKSFDEERVPLLHLVRCDVGKATDAELIQLLLTALTMNMVRLRNEASAELLRRPPTHDLAKFRLAALQVQLSEAGSPEELLGMLQEIEKLQAADNVSVGETILRQVSILRHMGREVESQEVLTRGFRNYPNDPYLLSLLQYAQQERAQLSSVDESQMLQRMVRRSEEAVAPPSSIVLPGAPATAEEGGKSKLWLPGS